MVPDRICQMLPQVINEKVNPLLARIPQSIPFSQIASIMSGLLGPSAPAYCYSPQCQITTTTPPPPPLPPLPSDTGSAAGPPNNPPAPVFDQDAGAGAAPSGNGGAVAPSQQVAPPPQPQPQAAPQPQPQPQAAAVQPNYQQSAGSGGTWSQAASVNGNTGGTASVSGGQAPGAASVSGTSDGVQPSGYGNRKRTVASGQPLRKVCSHLHSHLHFIQSPNKTHIYLHTHISCAWYVKET
ncbi:unnamed protein product [Gongylonema pulchrum]|uniref:CG10920-PA n=1 Tax=Gongylonema pulchrum TaxID=637853 RepID=A0A183EJS7_9BILA|nr:unnamed protein product [Gongylonema pulchrum]